MKKLLLILLIALLLSGAVVVLFGKDMLAAWYRPDYAIGARPYPAAPDYADPANWAAWPGRGGPAELVPAGTLAVPEADRGADVFYIHPTTNYSRSDWLAAVDDAGINRRTDIETMAGQASAFNACCRVYAPRYRQVSLAAHLQPDKSPLLKGLDVAYQDVAQAFDYFLAHRDPARPFILAAHSQGSSHLTRLLVAVIQQQAELRDYLVAAYVIGNRLAGTLFSEGYLTLPLCETPIDTGCVLGWDTVVEGTDTDKFTPLVGHWTGKAYEQLPPFDTICVNPVSWRHDTARTDPQEHKGGIAPLPLDSDDLQIGPPISHIVAAQCMTGHMVNGLAVAGERPEAFQPRLPIMRGSLHVFDVHLFYMDIRANAVERVAAWYGKQ